ncbi:MAG: metal ABC transporter solute-binding protein, Zn/Mn family [Pseudanabaenaceae cyanobacterium]
MIKLRTLSLVALPLLVAVGCSQPETTVPPTAEAPVVNTPTPTAPKLRVVAANSVLCDLTRQVGGDRLDLVCLIPAGQAPHEYKPTAEDAKQIETAQVVFYGGYNFEEGLTKLVGKSKGLVVAVSEQAIPKPIMVEGGHGHGHHHHDHDHGKAMAPDPHVWHDAKNGIKMVQTIAQQLSKADPQHADTYQQNAQALIGELQRLDTWIKNQVATIPPERRKLVTTHDALRYYTAAYGISLQSALLGISTTEQATPNRIAELVQAIRASGVPTIFAELTANPKLIEAVATEAQVKIADTSLLTDGLAEAGQEGATYQQMLIRNTRTIVQGLGGEFTPFQP